jgi:hypothetical protein
MSQLKLALKGHDFSRAVKACKRNEGFTGCGKTPSEESFVTGHEFTRAVNTAK